MTKTIMITIIILALLNSTTASVNTIQLGKFSIVEPNKELNNMPNVILLIGDGLAPEGIRAASLIEYGEEFGSIMDKAFPVQQLYTTNTLDDKRTDSDASGSAIASGHLVKNGAISMDPTESFFLKTILEYLQFDFGYSTGIVTTQVISHATPATFAAHHTDRKDLEIIRAQMLSKDISVLLGAGLDGPYWGLGPDSARTKGESYGYEVAVNLAELQAKAQTANKLLGVFAGAEGDHIGYELDRDINSAPSLYQMTDNALKLLERKNDPYFIMIEGGLIDYAGHLNYNVENKTHFNMAEIIAFEKTVRLAYDVAKADGNTIVVVASDHDTGGLILGDFSQLDNTLPSSENTREENMLIRFNRGNQMEMNWTWNAHTETPVKFFGYGSDFGGHNVSRNNEVFWAINKALGSFPTVFRGFTQNNDNLDVTTTINDLDNSADRFSVIIDYDNGSIVEFSFDLELESKNTYQVSVGIDNTQTYTAHIKIHDGETYDVISFDSRDQLINQQVIHKLETETSMTTTLVSTSTTTTSSMTSSITSEKSDEDESPIYQSFLTSFFILIGFYYILNQLYKRKQHMII